MIGTINFIVRGPHPSFYSNIMRSIVDPIRQYLPGSIISEQAMDDAVNVHFFHENKYGAIVPLDKGTSVFMSHGIADKGWRDGTSMRQFDYVCVSGPMWRNKLINEGVPAERILEVGFPKLDVLFQEEPAKQKPEKPNKRVLYAPTHARAFKGCSSFPAFLDLLPGFPGDLETVASPHPVHKEDQLPTLHELKDADVVISDSSSIVFEAWALGKPVVFPDWLVKKNILLRWPNSFTALIYRDGVGYHARDFNHLIELVYYAYSQGIDPKARSFIDAYFPKYLRGRSSLVCAERLKSLSMKIPGRKHREESD